MTLKHMDDIVGWEQPRRGGAAVAASNARQPLIGMNKREGAS